MKKFFRRLAANPQTTMVGMLTIGMSAIAIASNPASILDPAAITGQNGQTGPLAQLLLGIGMLVARDSKPQDGPDDQQGSGERVYRIGTPQGQLGL